MELGDRIAGPYCTKILADYGADVIKVETPGLGDPIRSVGPFSGDKPELETSGMFLYLNTNNLNLELGLPSLYALYIPEGVILQIENGSLGTELLLENEIEKADFAYHDAQGRFWRVALGMVFFDGLTSFAMIRGGRLITILGALQVSERGNLVNWNTGRRIGWYLRWRNGLSLRG